jgi:ABC-2 type transport system permease protein
MSGNGDSFASGFIRVYAVVLRQLYLYRRSFNRLLEVFYWPVMDLLLWGFVTVYLQKSAARIPLFVSFFIGALILWDILFRAEQGISVSFLEDMWSRNLVNVFVTPVRVSEYLLGLLSISVLKVAAAFTVMSVLGWVFYSFSIFKLGLALLPLAVNLVAMGLAVGIFTTALILRYGLEAEILAWAVPFLFMPFSAVFYPVDILPPVLKTVARFLPSAYSFEGMRTVIKTSSLPVADMLRAAGLNVLYISLAVLFFARTYKKVLIKGIIPKIGE